MNNIKLTYTKKTSNKYTLLTEVNGKIIGDRDYTGTKEDHDLFAGFVDFMNDLIKEELKDNPNFTFNNVDEFRAWANGTMQRQYVDYLNKL